MLRTFEFEGCPLAWKVEGSGPPLLMVQGVGAEGTSPNPQVEILSRHYTCLSLDNRGIGKSQPLGRRLTVPQMARDCLALMDHVGWRSAHLLGHSLGGLTAMQAALDAPSKVRSLTLLCSFANGGDAVRFSPTLLSISLRIKFGWWRARRRAFLELVLTSKEREGDEEALAARLSKVLGHEVGDAPAISDDQVRAMREHDVSARLGELSAIPTLVMNGAQDPVARPKFGQAIVKRISGAKYIEFPQSSHALPIFSPEECAGHVLKHLDAAQRLWGARP